MPQRYAHSTDGERLHESEARLALALAGSHSGIWQWDLRTGEVLWSTELLEIWGTQRFGGTIADFRARVHPDDIGYVEASLAEAIAKGNLYAAEFRILRDDGTERWAAGMGKCYYDERGTPLRVLGATTDITARKEAEAALREAILRAEASERRTLDLLDKLNEAQASTKIGSWDWLIDSDEVWWSDELYRIFGNSQAAFQPSFRNIALMVHPDDREAYVAERKRLQREGGDLDQEIRIIATDGRTRICRARATLHYDETGRPYRYFGTFQDITEQRTLEAAQNDLRQQLLRAQKMEALGQLTGGITHDFNNILASVLGYTSLALARHVLPEQTTLVNYLETVQAAALRGRDLVDKLLKFSRHAPPDQPSVIDPAVAVREAARLLAGTLPSTISITTRTLPRQAAILAPAGELQQILLNLGVNARDAILGHGEIRIGMLEPRLILGTCASCLEQFTGRYMEVFVTDTGIGIPADIAARVFDPFFTTKGFSKGSGLGLSITHGVVHQAGGHVLLESVPGKGTTFRLLFEPVDQAEVAATDTPAAATPSRPTGTRQRLLVVDDDPPLAHYLQALFEGEGYEAEAYTESSAALAAFRADPARFDGVVSDQTMPGLTGLELCRELRALAPQLPVLICSGYAGVIDGAAHGETPDAGVRFLRKPVDPAELLSAVHALFTPPTA